MNDELDRVIADYPAAVDAGHPPDPEALLAAHTLSADKLADFLVDDRGLRDRVPPARRPDQLAPGTVHAGYEVIGLAGSGGQAYVYRARQPGVGRYVALKVLAPLSSDAAEARFRYEAEAAGRLAHPHIAVAFDAGTAGGRPYLVMEFLAGGSWRDRLAAGPAAPRVAAAVVRDLARGVAAAHAAGVIHRDIKPANVLFDAAGRAKLADFGCAAFRDRPGHLTRTGEAVGTPQYMAPEQASDAAGEVTVAADVYGLGATLYAALSGRPPFPGDNLHAVLHAVIHDAPAPLRRLDPGVPADLAAVCGRCLEKAPARRYRSADELADDLDRFLAGAPVWASDPGPARRAAAWARRRPAAVTALAAAVLLAGGAAAAGAALAAAGVAREAEAAAGVAREAAAADRFFAALERVRGRRLEPRAGWTAASLADLRGLAADPRAAAHLPDLRSETAAALGGLDLERLPDLAVGFPGYAVVAHPTEPAVAVTERGTDRPGPLRVRAFDPRDGRLVREFVAPPAPEWQRATGKADILQSATVSPDGVWLAAGRRSGAVHVWRWATGELAATRQAHATGIEQLAFSGGGRWLYARTSPCDGSIRALGRDEGWALLPGDEAEGRRLPDVAAVDEAAEPIAALRAAYPLIASVEANYCRDGSAAFCPSIDGYATLQTPGGGFLCGRADLPTGPRSTACREVWAPDGRLLVEADEHNRVMSLWDMTAFRPALAALPTAGGSGFPAFDASGQVFYLAAPDAVARYAVRGRDVQEPVGWSAVPAFALAVSPDGRTVATVGARALDLPLNVFPAGAPAAPAPPARTGLTGIATPQLAVTDDGEAFASTGDGPGRGLARTGDGAPPADLLGVGGDPEDLRADGAGRLWVAAAHEVRVYDARTLSRLAAWHNGPAGVAAGMTVQRLAPARSGCLAGRRDGCLIELDGAAAEVASAAAFDVPVTAVARQASGGVGVAGSLKGELAAFGLPGLAERWRAAGAHAAEVTAVGVSDAGLVASGSADRTVRLWTAAGELVLTLRFDAPVRNVALTADGRDLFVLLSGERAVRRWRLGRLAEALRATGIDPGFE